MIEKLEQHSVEFRWSFTLRRVATMGEDVESANLADFFKVLEIIGEQVVSRATDH